MSEKDKVVIAGIIHNLEYAAYNLCVKIDSDINDGVVESTCPEVSLFLAIRELKTLGKQNRT